MVHHEISAHDLAARLQAAQPSAGDAANAESCPGFFLIDVREAWEVQAAAIENSLHIPMGEIPSRAHRELDPDAHIVVYCHRGSRSLSVVLWLREQGFARAQSLAGGIDGWSTQIDASLPRY